MKLGEIGSDQVVSVGPSDSVNRAFKLMVKNDIRHLPVVDGDKVVGIVSDRDLLMIVCWISTWKSLTEQQTSVGKKRVSELMSSPASVLSPDGSVEQAARLMLEGHLSAVPLERDGRIVSIVTETDILRCYLDDSAPRHSHPWCDFEVADHMAAAVVTAKLTDHVLPSFNLMKERQIRHLPIVDGDKLVGLISDRDLRRSYGKEIAVNLARDEPDPKHPYHLKLEDVMSRRVETVGRHTTLAHAASRMVHCKIGALPVTDRDDLLGIITETDLLRVFVTHSEA
jgi:CBS domain-containing protein